MKKAIECYIGGYDFSKLAESWEDCQKPYNRSDLRALDNYIGGWVDIRRARIHFGTVYRRDADFFMAQYPEIHLLNGREGVFTPLYFREGKKVWIVPSVWDGGFDFLNYFIEPGHWGHDDKLGRLVYEFTYRL